MRRILCGRRIFGRRLLTAASLAAAFVAHDAAAQPNGPAVVSGQATVSTPKPGTTIVQQTTEKAILNWPSLSVPSGNLLQFVQPNSAAIALNRVLSGVTAIDGSLIANGRVWIINPNGVLFGSNASVNVAGLIATTSDISNQDFTSGNYNFGLASTNPNAAILNAGAITAADGGAVVLSGPRVANKGVIAARLGTVALGAGNAFTVDFQGDKLLSFAVTAPVTQTPTDKQGQPASALVSNSGTINAAGGTVLLTARAARDVLDNVVNTTGMISATTAHDDNGTIVLDAGPDGTASVNGQVDASGKAAGATGGTVEVLGGTVAVNTGATINASGDRGGGTVLIGGNLHGAGPQTNATNTVVAPGASIDADAITSGNGGTVAVWANDHTVFDGTISVRGGAQGGNGGLVETSGQQALSVTTGTVDALAPKGQVGNWLLDPTNITVETGGTDTVAAADNSEFYFLLGTADFDIDPSAIASAQANVNLTASNNITFANSITMTNPGVGITAVAGNSITVDPGASITTQGGAIFFKSNFTINDIILPSGDGAIAIAAPLSTAGGGQTGGSVALVVSGGTGTIALAQNIITAGGSISLTGPTVVTAQSTLDTTNGGLFGAGAAVTLTGTLEGPQGLALDAGGNSITLATAVGDQTPLASLKVTAAAITFTDPVTVTGALDTTGSGLTTFDSTVTAGSVATGAAALDGSLITTTSGQSYGAATLAAPTTLTDTGASAITVGTVAGAFPLTINDAGGAITMAGTATGMPPLASLTATGATVAFNGALAVTGVVNTLAANLTTFDGAVTAGSVATGAVAIDGGSVTTVAGQNYGPATLGGNTTLTDNSGGAITFASTLDGSHTLTIDDVGGAVTFAGAIGNQAPSASLTATAATVAFDGKVAAASLDTTATGLTTFTSTVTAASVATGAVALDGSLITTSAGQRYGAVTLGGNTVLADIGASAITLAGTVQGAHTLTINDAGGAITLAGAVGTPSHPLSSLSATGATIAFDGPLDVATTVQTTAVGLTTFANTVAAASVATGAVMFDGPVITTAAGQSYGAATLGAPTLLTDTGASAITLGGTLSGANALTINDAGGAITLTGTTNGAPPLASLTATGATTAFDGALAVAGAVNTVGVGLTTFDGAMTAGSVTTGAVAFAGGSITTVAGQSYGPAMLDRNITLADTAGGAITFLSTLNGANALTLSDAGGTVTFLGAVGNQVPLASLTATAVGLTTFGNTVTAGSVATGPVALDGGGVTTTAGQTYGTATLGSDATLTDTSASAITFAGTLDGARRLTIIDAGGAVTFANAVGSMAPLGSLNATAAAVTFDGTVDVAGGLDLAASGLTTFDNSVTAGSVATGAVAFDGGGITTTAGQSYGAATLGTATALTDNGASPITLNGTLDGGYALTINDAGGTITLAGTVNGTPPLASLTATGAAIAFDGAVEVAGAVRTVAVGLTTFDGTVIAGSVATGAVALDGGDVTTSGGQSYGAAMLGGATVLGDTSGSAITFAATLDGAAALTVNDAGGAVTFTGAVGGHAAVASLNTSAVGLTTFDNAVTAGSVTTGVVALDGGSITTTAGQSYGTATLGAPTELTAAGAITFASTLDGGQSLTVTDAAGAVTFTGAVGSHAALASLNTSATGLTTFDNTVTAGSVSAGTVALNGGDVTTTQGQNYGAATLGTQTVLTDTGAGAITFASTLDGAQGLTIADAGGTATFIGAVGSHAALASVTATAAAITFDSAVAVVGALDTTAAGQTTFDNAVTAARVTTGAVALDGSGVATSAGQTYGGLATIGADTVLSDTGASAILFANGVGGTRSLTIADAGGAVTFQGSIGNQVSGSPMNLTVTSATLLLDDPVLLTGSLDASAVGLTTFAHGGVTTTGSQSYGPVTLATNVGLNVTSGGAITINGAVDAAVASAFSLGLSSNGGAITLNGPVGTAAVPLVSLSASGGAVTFAGPITVVGAVETAAALTTFDGTVTADSVATAAVALDGGAITTGAGQQYGAATLGADATLTDTGSGAIVFAGPVDGAHALTVDNFGTILAPATIDFAGAVGAKAPLTSLTASVASGGTLTLGGSVTTTGAQTYTASTLALAGSFYGTSGGNFLETGATQLTNTADIDTTGQGAVAGGNIAFTGQVSGGSNALSLAAGSGAITLAGVTTANLQLASGGLTLNGGFYSFGSPTTVVPAATLNGELTLNQATQFGPVTLGSATTIGSMSNIVFTAPIAGGTNSLTVFGLNATVSFAGVTSGALVLNNNIPILTTGAYDIGAGPYVFSGAEAIGALTFGQPTTFNSSLTVLGATSFDTSSVHGALSFTSIIDGQVGGSPAPLTINAGAGAVTLLDSIGTVTGPSSPGFGAVTVTGGAIALGANIATNAGSVTLTGATTLTLQQGIIIDTTSLGSAPSGANIVFAGAGTIDGAASLTLDAGTSGTISVGGAVGSGTKLAGLTASGAAIVFNGPVALTGGLDSSATGLTTFAGAVTAASVRTDAVLFDGGSVVTTSGQSYGAAPLVASNPPSTGSGSDSGTGSSDSGSYDLDDGAGDTALVPTLGSFTFAQDVTPSSAPVGGGAATLGTNMVLSDNGGAITFGGTLNGPHSLTINDAGGTVTLSGAVGGLAPLSGLTATSSTIAFGGPVSIAGALDTAAVGLTSFAGNVVAASVSTGSATIAGGSVVTSGSQVYAGGIDISADTTLAAGSDVTLAGTSLFNNAFALDVLAGGNVTVAGAVQNAGTGPITVVAGWDGVTPAAQAATTQGAFGRNGGSVVIGGADASGNAGLGSAGGTTTVAAADLGVQAVNGFAQLGYAGAGTSGAIDVTLTGSLALNGGPTAGAYAQIGHGGEGIGGSESGDIAVTAAGNVTLAGGSGSLAYAQIGHGGAFSNEHATAAFDDIGAITVAGDAVSLAGGSGSGAYAQIGHGGIGSAQDAAIAVGSVAYTGTITVAASGAMSLAGDGPEAYAQIGNGGYQSLDGTKLAEGTGITESGDITITTGTASSGGALQVMGDAYAQIGNGGYAANLGTNAPAAINEFGDIDVTVNGSAGTALVAAGDTGSFAYAQIGNGDAATVGVGNVGGNIAITVATAVDLRSGTSANAGIWNATGLGTVTGTTSVNGVIVAAPDNTISPTPAGPSLPPPALIAPWLLDATFGLSAETFGSLTNDLSSDTLGSSLNAIAPSSGDQGGKGPIEAMTDSKGGGGSGNGSNGSALPGGNGGGGNGGALPGAAQEADDLSSGIARTLSGTPGSVAHVPQTILIGGLLTEAAPSLSPRDTPQSIEPADQVYSSWGNEALWDWQ